VDVGAGDGKLAAWLAARGHRLIATENKPGPLAEVRRRLDPLGIEWRLGEGLLPVAAGEVEVAVIAGLGGRSIAAILNASPDVVTRLRALVLQPVQHRVATATWRCESFRHTRPGHEADRAPAPVLAAR